MVDLPHWPYFTERAKINPSTYTTKILLDALGNPEKNLPPTIHIAGTNGKGSTLAFLRYIFEAAGYKVHSYTSPHILRFNERIVLRGAEISDSFLYEVLEETRITAEENSIIPTFFEGTTAAAFLAFSRVKADVLLLETGMGGKFDSTNIINKPLATVITPISYDHMQFLGTTLSEIATQKAGIIKQNVPCIVSQQYEESFEVIAEAALDKNAKLIAFEYDWGIKKEEGDFVYKDQNNIFKFREIGLQGDHQIINAGTAIATIMEIRASFNINDEAIKQGLMQTKWPYRLQNIVSGPIYKKYFKKPNEFIIDGAHNEHGAIALSAWLEQQNNNHDNYLICGMTKGRNIEDFLLKFIGKVKYIYAVNIMSEPSSYKAQDIKKIIDLLRFKGEACESVEDALDNLSSQKKEIPYRVIACGSLFLAADIAKLNKL
jgi:dihydrofolate synthase/folylpolyglutamate synthase